MAWPIEQPLKGGVANAGSVVRVGAHVLRPSNSHSASIHRFLAALDGAGFRGASRPVGIDDDGRERFVYIEGDVPVPPYPEWAQADRALESVATLMRSFHEASRMFDPSGLNWSEEMADPAGGPIVCHNDVCLENVIFRDGIAVALIDFDFAAPGRPLYDLVQFARMCVPIDDDINAPKLGWLPSDKPTRLRLVVDAYGLDADERAQFLTMLGASIERGGQFVRRRVEAGDPNFIKMWNDLGGAERFGRRQRWWTEHLDEFAAALR
jgi:Phosphotransferase enzyme family